MLEQRQRVIGSLCTSATFGKSLSKELGPHGIRVNNVSPGPVSTTCGSARTATSPARTSSSTAA
ncbi:SDR family oxidoreductase [Microbispora rosea]|uniref:SDR family oxidoreductase n=1 Tax=Microbispora rosea TaxID=58117 RepID=UPI0034457F28